MIDRSSPSAGSAPTRLAQHVDWGDWLQYSLVLVALIALGRLLLGMVGRPLSTAIGETALMLVAFGAALLAWRTARTSLLDGHSRRGWQLLALAAASHGLADLLWLISGVLATGEPPVILAHGLTVAVYPLLFAALLWLVALPRTRASWMTMLLDVGALLLGSGMVIWYLVIWPATYSPHISRITPGLALAYPIAFVALLLGLVLFLLRWPDTPGRHSLQPLLLAGGLMLLADLGYCTQILADSFQRVSWPQVGWTIAFGLIGLAATRYRTSFLRGERKLPSYGQRLRLATPLPYFAVAIGFIMLVVVARDHSREPLNSLIVSLVALTGLVVVRQITALRESVRRMEQEVTSLRRSEERYRSLVQSTSDVITVIDAEGQIRYVTPSIKGLFGYGSGDLIKTRLNDLIHPDDLPRALGLFRRGGRTDAPTVTEWRLRHLDGSWRAVEVIGSNRLDDPNLLGIVLTLRDISDRRALEEQLAHQTLHDRVTGLVNRGLFQAHLSHALVRHTRDASELAVLCLGVDNLRTVIDSLGHAAADQVMITITKLLQEYLGPADTVARLNNDEFAILMEDLSDLSQAVTLAERVIAALATPLTLAETPVTVSVSIGIATRTNPQETADELLRNAAVALVNARRQGAGSYALFREDMYHSIRERFDLGASLHQGLERREFQLYYQPTVELRTGRITGLEALMRWLHPERGLIPPSKFIPLAEENGFILPLGRWALQEACAQAQRWRQQYPYQPPLHVSVNLSPRQLLYEGIIDDVAAALHASELEPRYLTLEITETTLGLSVETARERLERLKELGVQLAVDDFGTGYSSLSYLQRFPVDILKIDRSFIQDIVGNDEQTALTRNIIAIGRTLNLRTVAEGIEDLDQLKQLRRLACDLGQGYFFGRPLDAGQISALLGRRP